MCDMLVKLYELKTDSGLFERLEARGIRVVRAMPLDMSQVLAFVEAHFPEYRDECAFALMHRTCCAAVLEGQVVGFACYEATRPDYFGPTGVRQDLRGLGIGKALLIRCLEAMRAMGYAYAIIGWVGPKEFYRRTVGAVEIPDSIPGAYGEALRFN